MYYYYYLFDFIILTPGEPYYCYYYCTYVRPYHTAEDSYFITHVHPREKLKIIRVNVHL